MTDQYEAVVIGTGFGGAICACRLSKKWPDGKVLVLERGKRYPMGSFPRTPHDMARNFWNVPDEKRRHPKKVQPKGIREEPTLGMFDIRMYKRMDVVLGAGLGGGSLIYANVFLEPPDNVFDQRWPESCKKRYLDPYYKIAKAVLGSRPVPQNSDPRRRIVRTELFEKVASQVGRKSELVDINVFFGKDVNGDLLPIGEQAKNRFGALQTSCMYCAECDVGCNYHSKNTLDLNYLFVAANRYGAKVETEQRAEKIVPLGADGKEDHSADGSHGFHVYYHDLSTSNRQEKLVRANRVVVSAGALGSTEFLMRCRDVFKSLPRISQRLGHNFSGNGDFLAFVAGTDDPANPNYGPVITQRTDFNLFDDFDPQRAFVLEDASYPAFASWFVEAAKPGFLNLRAYWRLVKHLVARFVRGRSMNSVGFALSDLLSSDASYNAAVLLCMGVDASDGLMTLDKNGRIAIDWPQKTSRPLYDSILDAGKEFKRASGAKVFFPIPTWLWPLRRNVTVHSLGGCILGDDPDIGVTSAAEARFGKVFGYEGLYVADGAIVPTAVGANPTATISALSEMVAKSITGIEPDSKL